METLDTSETFVLIYQTTRRNISHDYNLDTQRRNNPISQHNYCWCREVEHFLRILGRRSIYCRICDSKFRPWSLGTPKRQKLVIITSGSMKPLVKRWRKRAATWLHSPFPLWLCWRNPTMAMGFLSVGSPLLYWCMRPRSGFEDLSWLRRCQIVGTNS